MVDEPGDTPPPPPDDENKGRDEGGEHNPPDDTEHEHDAFEDTPHDESESRALMVPPPSGGALRPYHPHGPGPLRDQVFAVMNNLFGGTKSHMNMVLQNIPSAIVDKKIAPKGVTVRNLPQVFDGADSYVKSVIFAIRNNPDLVPDEVDLQSIRQAFLALRLVQTELRNIADTYGHPKDARSARLSPKPYVDQADQRQNKRITALDVGAMQEGRSRRNSQLGASEQATLHTLSEHVGTYILVAAHLLGAQVTGFDLIEEKNLNKRMEHEDIAKLMTITPPQPWADAMKKLRISMPKADTERLRIIN